MTDNFST